MVGPLLDGLTRPQGIFRVQKSKKCGGKSQTSRKEKGDKSRVDLGTLPQGPDSVRVTLKYAEKLLMSTLTTTGAWTYVYRLNSVFDPNFTGTGHQPNGFDQWSAFYGKYRVIGGNWKVTMANQDAQYQLDVVAVERANDNSIDSNLYDYLQEPRSHYACAAPRGSPAVSLGSHFSNQRLLGLKKDEFADQDYAALVTTNPAVLTWLNLFVQVSGGELSGADQSILIEIEYQVEFYEREELDASFREVLPLIKQYEKSGDPVVLKQLSRALEVARSKQLLANQVLKSG